jgi:hypothetical protein
MQDLTEEDIKGVSYIKPELVDIYIKGYKEPIQYILGENNRFNPQRFTHNNSKPNLPFWRKSGFIYNIYESMAVHDILNKLDSKDLWTEKDEKNHIYIYIKGLQPKRQTRKRDVYNKNKKLLPMGWYRISENGKNWFEGPKAERYNRMNLHTNKNNSRVKNRTYKVVDGDESWYVLPDGSLSWTPYKVPTA